jgi:hypothetical protein
VGFFINLPIGIAMIWAALRFIAESPRSTGHFDVLGAITSTAGMTALVYGLIRSASAGWLDAATQGAVAGGVLLLAAFIVNERYAAQPIMPLRLFAVPARAAAYGARLLFLGAMIGFFFFTTQYLQTVLGYAPAITGLAFLPMTTVNFVVALQVPRLTARFGNGRLLGTDLRAGHGMAEPGVGSPPLRAGSGAADGLDRHRPGLDAQSAHGGRHRRRAGARCRGGVRRGECGPPAR